MIAEIETDKATMEIEAVEEGRLGKILIEDGTEGVKVNTPIALILADGEAAGAAMSASGPRRRAHRRARRRASSATTAPAAAAARWRRPQPLSPPIRKSRRARR